MPETQSLFDMSKAAPIQGPSAPLFDMSKAKPISRAPNASLAPPAGSRGEIGNVKPPMPQMEGSVLGRSDAGPEALPPGKIPRSILDKPADWKDNVIGGAAVGGAALLGGEAAAPLVRPIAKAGVRFVAKHPIITMGAIEAAKQLPGTAGRIAGKIPSWLPLLAGGKEEGEIESSAPPPVRYSTVKTEPEALPETAPPPVKFSTRIAKPSAGPEAIPTKPAPEPPPIARPTSNDPILDRLRTNAAKIEQEGHGDEIPEPVEAAPITTNLNQDLTPALKASLAKVRAAKRIARPNSPAVQ
jgi:hypothetical protein